jgi:hypothetical protein
VTFQAACMTEDERALWEAANEIAERRRRVKPCADCPFAFAERMREVNRCNGIPRAGRRGRLPGDGRGRLGWAAA